MNKIRGIKSKLRQLRLLVKRAVISILLPVKQVVPTCFSYEKCFLKKSNKGISLIYIIFLITILFIMGTAISGIVHATAKSLNYDKEYIYAFYLAEGAVEYGKTKLHGNPSWYTDLPSYGNIINWLKNESKGLTQTIASSYKFKVIKEYNGKALYGMGFYNNSCAIIKYEDKFYEEL